MIMIALPLFLVFRFGGKEWLTLPNTYMSHHIANFRVEKYSDSNKGKYGYCVIIKLYIDSFIWLISSCTFVSGREKLICLSHISNYDLWVTLEI